jgi:hypothetical protein
MEKKEKMSQAEITNKLLAKMKELNFSQLTIDTVMGYDYYHDTILMVLEKNPNIGEATVMRLAMDE